jgi:Mg-chelatase subunit ChlD
MLRGRELTGDIYGIHMTAKREDWGHTRMTSRALHVTPLPILRGDRHGRDIVEGLILHEIGHHVWHRGKAAAKVWKRANKAGLFPLLNLVADEHLERNLRSIAAEFGDRIKRLDAYAFQHAAREIGVDRVLGMLLGAAVEVLPGLDLAVAYSEDSVRVDSGRILAELDRRGHPFARFVRALRMGLGNRSGDPRVEAGLALFRGGFRANDMAGLYEVTLKLAEIFGSDVVLCNGFGGHESIEWDDRDADIHGDGISDADVQREVERILEAPRGGPHAGGGGPRRLQINVGGDASYKKIDTIQPLTPQPAVHKAEAGMVSRHALRLRDTLTRLGLARVPTRGRLRGHAFDRTRARAVVLRGDPRMLVSRETRVMADLFLGVVIDCSGSMTGDNIARAKRFGVLVAEAARGLPGVDARFFGFTDRVIYEAGDAQRCAVTSLQANGGNNDAAALDHVAQVAAKSMRRAKLLVMVSDGLPTECSVAALKGVVHQLSRRYAMCCAQVAVRELDERCFPHYVVLDDANLDLSVRRFGDLIGRLVGRAITG